MTRVESTRERAVIASRSRATFCSRASTARWTARASWCSSPMLPRVSLSSRCRTRSHDDDEVEDEEEEDEDDEEKKELNRLPLPPPAPSSSMAGSSEDVAAAATAAAAAADSGCVGGGNDVGGNVGAIGSGHGHDTNDSDDDGSGAECVVGAAEAAGPATVAAPRSTQGLGG